MSSVGPAGVPRAALVTGAGGFMGRHAVRTLRGAGWKVWGVDRPGGRPFDADEVAVADLTTRCAGELLGALPPRIDAVLHLAAAVPNAPVTQGDQALSGFDVNVRMTDEVLLIAEALRPAVFVHAGGASVYGVPDRLPVDETHPVRPTADYPRSKLDAERLCLERLGVPCVAFRISSPYGPGMPGWMVLARFVGQAVAGAPLSVYGSGSRSQDFVHVEDICRGFLLATARPTHGVFNLGSGVETSMLELAQLVTRVTGRSDDLIRVGERPDPEEGRRFALDIRRAGQAFGYRPRWSLSAGLGDLTDAVRRAHERGQ